METFSEPKELAENSHYQAQRQKCLAGLSNDIVDVPIIETIKAFNTLPYCFTIQSCYGHFLYDGQNNPQSLAALPITETIAIVEYRIAYIAFCIEHSNSGRLLLKSLKKLTVIDPKNIQFCCAEWFWKRQINSYVLQVEPERFKHEDRAEFAYKKALNLEKTRNTFFVQLKELLQNQHGRNTY